MHMLHHDHIITCSTEFIPTRVVAISRFFNAYCNASFDIFFVFFLQCAAAEAQAALSEKTISDQLDIQEQS